MALIVLCKFAIVLRGEDIAIHFGLYVYCFFIISLMYNISSQTLFAINI